MLCNNDLGFLLWGSRVVYYNRFHNFDTLREPLIAKLNPKNPQSLKPDPTFPEPLTRLVSGARRSKGSCPI